MALNMAVATLISMGISKIIDWFNSAEKAMEDAAQSARDLESEISSLDDYEKKIAKLREEIDSGNLSYEQATSKRQELMAIQDELISKYGSEAAGIDLVTGSIESQKEAIDNLKKSEMKNWLNSNFGAINNSIAKIESSGTIKVTNMQTPLKAMSST